MTTTPTTEERGEELRQVHRRIRDILDRFPASSWDHLAEAEAVLAALAGIVRGRPERERLPSRPSTSLMGW
jgi:hypothetical protein